MALIETDLAHWRDRVKMSIPAGLHALLGGVAQRELLKQVDALLLVFDGQVFDLASSRSLALESGTEMSASASASAIASACAQLLGSGLPKLSVVLLLPAADFAATTVSMPGLAREQLLCALRLQASSLLPSLEPRMQVVVNTRPDTGELKDVALWMQEARLDDLFQAFADQQLFLTAVMPSLLALLTTTDHVAAIETTADTISCVAMNEGVITQWLQINSKDLEQEVFLQQWRKATQGIDNNDCLTIKEAAAYFELANNPPLASEYCFFPAGSLQARREVEKGRRLLWAGAAFATLVILLLSPFMLQTFELYRLSSTLESVRELSSAARDDRSVVQEFENTWGPINDFPVQNVRDALFTLQNILSPEQLTSFELSEGIVKIEGNSAQPQAILQRLEQDAKFTEVAFSRATNNSSYYIDLRLSTVNFEGYNVRYFPKQ